MVTSSTEKALVSVIRPCTDFFRDMLFIIVITNTRPHTKLRIHPTADDEENVTQ